MFPIVVARPLARGIKLFEIKAPRIAKKQRPGQFVIVRLDDIGERIPLTIEDADPEAGTITIVVQAIGKTTMLLSMLEAGDSILDVVGPLGKPSEIENFGTAVVVSGSVGTAMAYPTARELKRAGNKVISIVGARSKDLLVLEDAVREVSDETYVLTDDGTAGEKGLVTKKLQELVDTGSCRARNAGERQVAAPLMARRAAHGALRPAHRRFQPGDGVGVQVAGLRLSGKPQRPSQCQFGHETLVLGFVLIAPAAVCPGQHCAVRRQRGRQVAPCGHGRAAVSPVGTTR